VLFKRIDVKCRLSPAGDVNVDFYFNALVEYSDWKLGRKLLFVKETKKPVKSNTFFRLLLLSKIIKVDFYK
jgi:hypothetical protein